MGNFLKKIGSFVAVIAFWIYAIVRLTLDVVGWSTAPDDVSVALTRLDQIAGYILGIPWWASLAAAVISTIWITWIWRPRPSGSTISPSSSQLLSGPSSGALSVVANRKFSKAPVKIDGHRFINCEFDDVLLTWDGGPYMFENTKIEPARISGFMTNNPEVRGALHLFGLAGLLHPRGLQSMGIAVDPADQKFLDGAAPMARSASIKLKLPRNGEPLEISKENVWRWHVNAVIGKTPDGETAMVMTYFFLVFDRPMENGYYRTSCTKKNVRTSVADYTNRSAILTIEGDIQGSTVEFMFSADPI